MPRETSRHGRDDHDRRKADRERDRDHDRRRDRDAHVSDRRRESDSDNRTRATATAADFTSMPNPTSFTSMPFAETAVPPQFSSPPRQYAAPHAAAGNIGRSQRRRAPSSSSSGSSTASSLLDISRHYPQSRYGGFFGTFFKAPSERRRRRRSAARSSKRRTFYFGGGGSGTGNTSSSSVNSDLAYGYGYIPKLQRRRSSGGSNSFRQGVTGGGRVRDVVDNAPRRPEGPMRGKTDEEILEIGRQLSDLARKQNKHDLKAAGYVKPTLLAAAAAGVGKYRKSRKEAEARGARGIGSSKIYGASSEESDWEDASDEEEESDGADSVLAYGSVVSSVVRPNLAGRSTSHGAGPYAAGAGATTAAAAAAALTDPERRGSVVDPRLFGPVNSLRGMINTPCGFGQEPHAAVASPTTNQTPSTYQTTADARRYPAPPTESSVDGRRPMREVYPMPTSDPGVFDADLAASQELPRRARTSTVPLEQPIPKLPVSSKVYNAEKFEDTGRRQRDAPPRHDSTAAGFAAAAALGAAGAAALASDRKEDKKERKSAREYERERDRDRVREKDRDRERERERERERDKDRRDRDRDSKRRDKDSEKEKDSRKSKRDSYSSSKHDDKDHKRHFRYDDEETPRKRRETEADYYADSPSSSRRDRSRRGGDDTREELSRSSRRDSKSHSSRDDRKEDKGKSVDRYDFSYNQGAPISKVDPFLYQVADGAFSTADLAAPTGPPGRPLTPNIVTIDREPNFDDYEPYKPYESHVPLVAPEARLSRRDSFEMEERVHAPQDQAKRYDHGSHVYEEGELEARSIYDQTKHATIPVAAAAVASAIVVEAERSRERRRDRYDEEGSRDRESWKRDTVQEEADRYYRESVIARKIEEEQMRSETPENDDARQVRIVTPPEMHKQHKTTGPYDAPNADVRIDNELFPTETSKFEKKNGKRKSNFKSRDPSCERDRPVLNLVFPTPLPSREPTPKVEKQVQRDQQPEPQAKSDSSPEVVIGPRGDLVKVESSNKSVSWGENSTKSFEVESADGRSDAEKEKAAEPTEKPRARLSRASPWGIIAAAVAGSSSEPSGEPDTVTKRGSGKDDYGPKAADARDISAGPEQVYTVEARDQPPVPGPKPTSPTRDTLPGSFADDIEFAATLAAGLKDTGFDSNIVVDDPTYRRRDSPPGTREANGDEWNQISMSDIVMDIASNKDPNRSVVSEPAGIVRDQPANGNSSGNVGDEWEAPKKLSKKDKKKLKNQSLDLGESSTPTESSTAPESTETPTFEDAVEDMSKFSKKEQKRREKQAKALALLEGDGRSPQPEPEVVERSPLTEGAAADTWEEASSKKEKKKKSRKSQDAAPEDLVTVPSNAFDDLTSLRKSDKDETASIGVDDWDIPSKSKRRSKSERDDERPRSVVAESEVSTSSKKSSSKSKRRSGTEGDFDGYGSDASKKSSSKSKRRSIVEADDGYGSDAAKKSSTSRHRDGDDGYASDTTKKSSRSKHRAGDDGYGSDTTKKSSKSKHRDGDDGYGSDFSRRSSKSKRRSGTEGDFDYGSDTPSRRRSMFDDRDVSSVVSEARGDGRRREREKDRDRDRDRDRDGRSSSKRSSRRYDDDDDDARSVVSVASAPGGTRKSKEGKRSSGLFASIFKRDDDKKEKESSFLDNAGTLGAGVGLAGAAAIVAAGASRSHATDRSSSEATPDTADDNAQSASRVESHNYDTFDPEIAPRAIKPAIDPQYGDLLPLPPSEPGSPRPEPGELPALPDSRPNTPPDGHDTRRDQLTHRRRRSTQETPSKSPSNTAIPISLRLGQRAPLSPSGIFKSPPATTAQSGTAPDSASKRASRGTSWDSSREIKPLYLLEHSRHGSVDATLAKQEDLPALPPSQSASEISFTEDSGSSRAELASSGLHIDTRDLPLEQHGGGSQETTPKAEVKPTLPFNEDPDVAAVADPDAVDSMSKDRSSYLLDSTPSSTKTSSAPPDGEAALPLPDVADDLTSADERFEDALDVQSRRWSEDSAAVMQDASEHPQNQQSEEQTEPLTRELVAHAPLPPIEAPEPDEWAGLSAKQRKKLRKAKKNQSLELGEPTPAESPPEPVSESEPKSEPALERELAPVEELAPELASTPVPENAPEPAPFAEVSVPEPRPAPQPALETVPEPALEPSAESVPVIEGPVTSVANASNISEDLERTPTQYVFQEPKKGKKGKKNKKKLNSWEDDAMEAAPIVAGTAVLAGAAALVTEVTANKESAAAFKSEVELHSSTDAAHSSPAEAQNVPAEVKGLALETEPHPAEQKLEQVKSLVGEDAAIEVMPTHAENSLDAQAAGVQDTGADGEDEWSTTSTSKNDKKKKNKKKKKSLVVDDIPADLEPLKEAVEETPVMAEKHEEAPPAEPESTAEATQDRVAAAETQVQVAAETPVEEIISAKDAVSAVPQPESITNTPADADEGSTPSSSDKDKKKKKNKNKNRKSLSPDEAPLELQPESEAVHETPIASEQAFKDLAAEKAPTTAPEQTEIEVAAESQTGSTDNTLEAEDFSPNPATSKKDKKKKKKRSSVVFEDPMPADDSLPTEDPVSATDDQTPTPLDLEQPEPVSNEDTVVEEAPEEPATSEQQQELKSVAKPEDEFAVVTKDKKKKKKDKRKSVQFEATPDVFSPPPQEEETAPGTDLPETRDVQDDPAAATLQPQDTVLSTQESVFDETEQQLGSASTTQTDSQPLIDDWNAPVPKKKGKKNKKNQKDGSATEDSATPDKDAADFARQMEFGDVVPAPTATEFDNKVDLTDEISAEAYRSLEFSDATAAAEETKDKAVVESEDEWSRLISGNKPAELREDTIIASHHTEAPDMIVDGCEKRDEALELEAKAESPAQTEPSVEEWPVATGKKGKKGKKNKKSASSTPPEVPPPQLDTVVTTETETSAEAAPEPEPEPEPKSVPQSADAAEAEPLRHATEAEPVELAAKELATQAPSEPTADEAASFPPAKLSKKDKKKMKKLSVFQDVDDDAPKEVHEAETATTVEKTSEQPLEKSLDDGAEIVREVIVEPVTSVAETPEPTPEPESTPVQQEEANPADEWGGLARKPSKKDKKKKKKQASVDEPKLEATESVLPTESMESTAPVKETEPENVIAAALETEPEPQLAELEQSTPDESLDGVSAKASKKDKKKKKMKQAAFEIAEAEAIESKNPNPEPQPELKEVDSGSLELQSGVEQPEGEHQPIKAPMLEADAAPVQDDAVQAEPQPVSKEASPENLAQPAAAAAAEPEDDSGGLSRKLSKKKEKKAKKKAQGEATAHTLEVTPAEDTMVEKTNEQLVEATTTNLPKELDESKEPSPNTSALDSMTEADSGSFATKLSTKDKKNKKNQSINEIVQALDGAPAEDLAEPPIEQSMNSTIAQDADGESRGLAEPLTESTRQETVLEDEQAVNAESSKMETEAKELTGETSVLPEETQETPRNLSDEKPAEPVTGAVAGMLSSEPAPEPPAEAVVPDAVSETPAKEAETEIDWGSFASGSSKKDKKKNKKKKAKNESPLPWEEPTTPPSEETSTPPVAESQETVNPLSKEERPELHVELASELVEPAAEPVVTPASEPVVEPTPEPAIKLAPKIVVEPAPEALTGEVEAAEEGSSLPPKSSKRDKKKKRKSVAEVMEPTLQEPTETTEEQPLELAAEVIPEGQDKDEAPEVPTEPVVKEAEPEDESMAGLSKKEKKKLKRAGLAAAALGAAAGAVGASALIEGTPEAAQEPEQMQDVKDDAKQAEIETAPVSAAAESEATQAATKPMPKKDKKKAKKLDLLLADITEPTPITEEVAAPKMTAEEAAVETPPPEPPTSSWADEMDDNFPLATKAEVTEEDTKAADESGFEAPISRKKSKKDKKRKSVLDSLNSPPSEPTVEADAAVAVEEPAAAEPAAAEPAATEPVRETSAPAEAQAPALEEDAWALPTKKGKKGKKGQQAATLNAELEPVPAEQPAAIVPEASQPAATRETSAVEPTQTVAAAAESAVPAEDDAEDMWAMPSKKKKGKKSKSTSPADHQVVEEKIVPEPVPVSVPEPIPELAAEPAAELAAEFEVAPEPALLPTESKAAVDSEPTVPAAEADDEVPQPMKKKGKKSKKPKSISLAEVEETENKGVSEPVADSNQSVAQPEPKLAADNDSSTTTKKGKGKKAEKMSFSAWEDSVGEPSNSEAPMEVENDPSAVPITENTTAFVEEPGAMSDTEVRGDDNWAVPVKKKSKKDKKRQSAQEAIPDTKATAKLEKDLWNDDEFFTAEKSRRDDAITTGDEKQERRYDEAVSVGDVERDDLPDVEMTTSVDDKFSSSDSRMTTTERSKSTGSGKGKASRDSLEAVGAAAAITGGVAALAQMYGGGKKKKGKKSKIVDKRQPQEDDMFDDPALWEGADKKNVVEESRDEVADDGVDEFWGPSRPDPGPSMAPQTPAGTSFTESGDEWKETARQGVPVNDEFVESPILGLEETSLPQSTPAGLLRRDSRLEKPVGGLFEEAPRDVSSRQLFTEPSELRSSPTRGLPAVQELPEAEKAAATGEVWPANRTNRDSGFIPESPPRRRSPHIVDEKIRDSGVDSGDWPESTHMQTPEARSRDVEGRLGPSPFNTPILHEPSRHDATTPIADPEKKLRRSNKDYGGLATAAAGASMLAAGAAHRDDKGHGGDDRRAVSDSHAATGSRSALRSEQAEAGVARRSVSNTSLSRQRTPEPLKLRPESPGSISGFRSTATPTPPPLRRVDKRMSGDLRALRQQNNSTPPVANEARVRTKDMADVYDGYGEGRLGSPKSPTRPHSMRRRQSMQVLELESRVEQLVAENRLLTEARNHAEQTANRSATSVLSERDAEIDVLKQSLQHLQNEVNRLTEVNEGLTSANAELASKDNSRYPGLAVYGDGTRGLEGLDGNPVETLEEKDAEIASLREQLEAAKEQVREMQRQILASKAGDSEFLNIRDEDYFDNRCQQLCSHVQQWVLRFSKFSDMRACRLTSEINDEKTIDRLDNAVLDGSDVDVYLNDRVKRRDIFMSMTMSMIWEFVFTRYLFGMDREQRQKLKSLEKLLTEVGPQNAVRQWRAVTLTLLAKRASFLEQRELDTEAVVQAIFQTLCKILPPPSNLENQIQSQLRRVMREAVDLSVTMRTQRAEYMMLPPLQPEYDADGELAATVQFNASMMNERSAQNKQSNEEIEADNSIVRVVLFPLVVKKGDDTGVGDDEIVVCPAQVLIAREHGRRHVTPSSDAGGASLLGAPSRLSVATDAMLSQPDA